MDTIQQRDGKLSTLMRGLPMVDDFPLIKSALIDPYLYYYLRRATAIFLAANIQAAGYNPAALSGDVLVQDYGDKLLDLPNVTPNGLIRPKLETWAEFNLVHRCLGNILRSLRIDPALLKMRAPVSIRCVDGVADKWIDERPKANCKMHSDFWSGGCCDLALLIPLFGDIENTTIKFAEPVGMRKSFLQETANYSSGEEFYDHYVQYPITMSPGRIYFQDIYCLHATWRRGGGIRVSMDWTVQTANYPTIGERHSPAALARDNHFPLETWYRLGRDLAYVDTETFEECRARHPGGSYAKHASAVEEFSGYTVKRQVSPTAKVVDLMGAQSCLRFAGE